MPYVANNYKDRLFNFIFGSEGNKEWTLSLYNAMNGTSYRDPSMIEINTIKEVLYLGMHNDVSFLITPDTNLVADTALLNLYEQQSTYNPNMPLRLLQYLGSLYEKYINARSLNKYGSELILLPPPRLVVFYNGVTQMPDEQILRLSDSFPEGAVSDVEVCVRMLNINYGRNEKLLKACGPLSEYSFLILKIRESYQEKCLQMFGQPAVPKDTPRETREQLLTESVDQGLGKLPENTMIRPFLLEHRAEVKDMLLTEYNEAEAMKLFFLDGERKGRKEGRNATFYEMVQDRDITPERAAQKLGISVKQLIANMTILGYKIPGDYTENE